MKTKHIILLVLAVLFNDFCGAIIAQVGILILKLGHLFQDLPTII